MAEISIVPFYGMSPRIAERLLGDGWAIDATNLILTSGEIRPIRQPELVHIPAISGPWLAVYRAEQGENEVWLSWAKDVDVARAPLPPSAESRYYWTGDNEPRFAKFSQLPSSFFSLGIPKPKTAPAVSPSGGTGVDVSRVYGYTFFSELGEESALSPVSALTTGKIDATWAISGMDAFPASSGTGTASHSSGVTTFTNTGFHWLRAGEEITIGSTNVVVASTPSPTTFTVPGNFAAETSWSRVAPWNTANMKRRLYRSAGTAAQFQLVDDDVGTTYNDTLSDSQILGDELISIGWELPPVNLQGLISLPNGAMVGFFDNQVCYSEPFQPHAWPVAYRRATDFEVVAIESYGTTVIAGTAGPPYILEGQEPQFVTAESDDNVWPCLSKRSMISVGDGVMYATSYGLAYLGLRGASIFTNPLFTRVEWAPLNPTTMFSAYAEGRIFVRYRTDNGEDGVLIFDLENPNLGLSKLSFVATEIYSDPRNGRFYLVDEDGVKLYDNLEGARLNYSWRSREYSFSKPVNFGAAKVDFVSEMSEADAAAAQAAYDAEVQENVDRVTNYSGIGALNGTFVNQQLMNGSNIVDVEPPDVSASTFTLYRDQQVVFAKQLVADQSPFKLPAGYKDTHYTIGITGTLRIKSIKVAETLKALERL